MEEISDKFFFFFKSMSLKSKLLKRKFKEEHKRLQATPDAPENFVELLKAGQFTDVQPETLKFAYDGKKKPEDPELDVEHFRKAQQETARKHIERKKKKEKVPESSSDSGSEKEKEPIEIVGEHQDESSGSRVNADIAGHERTLSHRELKAAAGSGQKKKKTVTILARKKQERLTEAQEEYKKYAATTASETLRFHQQDPEETSDYGGRKGKMLEKRIHREPTGLVDPETGEEDYIEFSDIIRHKNISKRKKPLDEGKMGISMTESEALKEAFSGQFMPGDLTEEEIRNIIEYPADARSKFEKRWNLVAARKERHKKRDEYLISAGKKAFTDEEHRILDEQEGLDDDAIVNPGSFPELTEKQKMIYRLGIQAVDVRPVYTKIRDDIQADSLEERFLELNTPIPDTMLEFHSSMVDYIMLYEQTAKNFNREIMSMCNIPPSYQTARRLNDIVEEFRRMGVNPFACSVVKDVYVEREKKFCAKAICVRVKFNPLNSIDQEAINATSEKSEVIQDPEEVRIYLYNNLYCNVYCIAADENTSSKMDERTDFSPVLDKNWYSSNDVNSVRNREKRKAKGMVTQEAINAINTVLSFRVKILHAKFSTFITS